MVEKTAPGENTGTKRTTYANAAAARIGTLLRNERAIGYSQELAQALYDMASRPRLRGKHLIGFWSEGSIKRGGKELIEPFDRRPKKDLTKRRKRFVFVLFDTCTEAEKHRDILPELLRQLGIQPVCAGGPVYVG